MVFEASLAVLLRPEARLRVSIGHPVGLTQTVGWRATRDQALGLVTVRLHSLAQWLLATIIRHLPFPLELEGNLLLSAHEFAFDIHIDGLLPLVESHFGSVAIFNAVLLLAIDAVAQLRRLLWRRVDGLSIGYTRQSDLPVSEGLLLGKSIYGLGKVSMVVRELLGLRMLTLGLDLIQM